MLSTIWFDPDVGEILLLVAIAVFVVLALLDVTRATRTPGTPVDVSAALLPVGLGLVAAALLAF